MEAQRTREDFWEDEKIGTRERNLLQRGVDWQMKIDDARTKLKSVYPTIKLL
jgi:hypothetical protein